MPTRIVPIGDGSYARVHTGPEAKRLRAQIQREREALQARYDLDPRPHTLSALKAIADTEAEIGRRMARQKDLAA